MSILLSRKVFDETVAVPGLTNLSCRAIDRSGGKDDQQMNDRVLCSERRGQQHEQASTLIEQGDGISAHIQKAFLTSSYSLKNIRCKVDDLTVSLSGFVNRYFDLQMATQIARRLGSGRRIELQIEVLSKPFNF